MKITIGSDHRGFEVKSQILSEFKDIEWIDVGAFDTNRSDYPVFAKKAIDTILKKETNFGVLICGSGIGMAIAANRRKGIYAALCWSKDVASVAYEDDGANVLVLSSDFVSIKENLSIVKTMINSWKNNTFKGGRYQTRLEMIDK